MGVPERGRARPHRDTPATVGIPVSGDTRRLRNLVSEQPVGPRPAAAGEKAGRLHEPSRRAPFSVTLEPHSCLVIRIEQ